MDDLDRILKNAGLVVKTNTKQPPLESVTKTGKNVILIENTDAELSEYSVERYRREFDAFMNLDETAGVGVNAEHNTYPYTPDIKKGTLKKTGAKLGFDITDGGIPPQVSKDSILKK